MNGRVDEREGGRTGGWTNGRVDEWEGGRTGGWTNGRVDKRAVDMARERTGAGGWANGQRMVQWARENEGGSREWWVWAMLGRHSLSCGVTACDVACDVM